MGTEVRLKPNLLNISGRDRAVRWFLVFSRRRFTRRWSIGRASGTQPEASADGTGSVPATPDHWRGDNHSRVAQECAMPGVPLGWARYVLD